MKIIKNTLGLVTLAAVLLAFTPITLTNTINAEEEKTSEEINWQNITLEEAKKLSAETGKPIFVDVSAVWCGYCKKMKRKVYTEESVSSALNKKYISIAIDGEKGEGIALVKKHKVRGYPTQFVFDANGKVLKRNDGYLSESKLLSFLK